VVIPTPRCAARRRTDGTRWACFAYLLWLALMILRDTRMQPVNGQPVAAAQPMSYFEALMFQLINPKAWMMAVTVVGAFYGNAAPSHLDLTVAALVCFCIGGPCMLVWTAWGAALDHVLKQPRARRSFGYCMAALVLATAVWMLY
jgi:threonine/homoserine/homoserine lactone efflux protein